MRVCLKCGRTMTGIRVRYCGPEQRVGWCPTQHRMDDASEHLVCECDTCGHYTTSPCAAANS